MFSNLLIGVDGRDGGRDAIALATRIVDEGGKLTLAHVYQASAGGARLVEAAARAGGVVEKARLEADLAADVVFTRSPSVGRGLYELAEQIDADLIIVGSSRRSLHGRVLMTDHALEALNAAPCAVLIAPSGYRERSAPLRSIGVGYDGSPESEHALAAARVLASERGAKLSALEVVHVSAYPDPAHEQETSIDDLIDSAHDRIVALGDVEPHAVYGDPAEELGRFGTSLDLLIVGSRGFGPLGRLVHGSTSRRLMHFARCPLLVLARTSEEPAAAIGGGPGTVRTHSLTETPAG